MEKTDTKMAIISIDDKLSIHFVYVPMGYKVSKLSLTGHETRLLGKLKSFNRIKLLQTWKKDHKDLVQVFTDALKNEGWDFDQFPNPTAYAAYPAELFNPPQ